MRILVVGAGQIGSRHMQGLATVPEVAEVVAVDPSAESRARAEGRWLDVPEHAGKRLVMTGSFDVQGPFDAAVVATNATGRLENLRRVTALGVRHVLAEKLLFQSLDEWGAALALARETDLEVYANYVYRYAAPWAALRHRLGGARFSMTVTAGDIGLATNLPHWLDLFEFVGGSALADLQVEALATVYPSKRGGGLLECSGALGGVSATGSRIALRFSTGEAAPRCRIETDAGWIDLDETRGAIEGPLADPDWRLETPMVSRITSRAIPEILAGQSPLPDLGATAGMNRLMLRALGDALVDGFGPQTVVPIT